MIAVFKKITVAGKVPSRAFLTKGAGQAAACYHADARTHHLDKCHQWPCEESRPEERRTKLRTGNRIGCDARRIVVGCACSNTWAKNREKSLERIFSRATRH